MTGHWSEIALPDIGQMADNSTTSLLIRSTSPKQLKAEYCDVPTDNDILSGHGLSSMNYALSSCNHKRSLFL